MGVRVGLESGLGVARGSALGAALNGSIYSSRLLRRPTKLKLFTLASGTHQVQYLRAPCVICVCAVLLLYVPPVPYFRQHKRPAMVYLRHASDAGSASGASKPAPSKDHIPRGLEYIPSGDIAFGRARFALFLARTPDILYGVYVLTDAKYSDITHHPISCCVGAADR